MPRCHAVNEDGRQRPEIRLTGALRVALVVELLHRRISRVPVGKVVGEFERADARVDRLWSVLAGRHGTPQAFSISGNRHVFFSNSDFSGP
jgi:hypothetical protein